jgi:hypothetical protein
VALRADESQYQYRFTLDDQQGTALRGTARLCRLPEQELYEIARQLDVDVRKWLYHRNKTNVRKNIAIILNCNEKNI